MAIPPDAAIVAAIELELTAAGADLANAPTSKALIESVVTQVMTAVRASTVSTVVTVAGPTGPLAGTGVGGLS